MLIVLAHMVQNALEKVPSTHAFVKRVTEGKTAVVRYESRINLMNFTWLLKHDVRDVARRSKKGDFFSYKLK